MPTIDPNTEPMNLDDLLQLESELKQVSGWRKVKPTLSFQECFFGLMGTAVLLAKPNGTFHPMVFTNIPNTSSQDEAMNDSCEFDNNEEENEEENEFNDEESDEFRMLAEAMISMLAPCFRHEKQPRFFESSSDLSEFVATNIANRFDGYKLVIIPICKIQDKRIRGLVILYTYDDSQFLTENDTDPLSQVWGVFANSLKLLV